MFSKKLYAEVYNLIMTLLIFLATAILIQKLLLQHLSAWSFVLYCSPCFTVYFAGRLLHKKKSLFAIPIGIAASLALSAIPIYLSFELSIFPFIAFALVPILTSVLFTMAYVSGPNAMGSSRFVSGLIIFIGGILVGGAHAENYRDFLNTSAIIFLIAGLFAFNRENLREASKQSTMTSKGFFPPGMRKSNAIMIIAMVAVGFVIANFERLRNFIVEAAKFVLRTIFMIIYKIMQLLAGGEGSGADGAGGDFNPFPGGKTRTPNPIIETIVQIVVIIAIVAAALFVLYILIKTIRKLIKNLPDWLRRLFDKLNSVNDETYIDETEDLLGKGGLRQELKKSLSDLWDRITYRPARFEDMPDNRSKVRFVFKNLLKRVTYGKQHLLSKTPNELSEEANKVIGENTYDFIQAYNRARYDSRDVPDKDAELAKRILRKL